jgi:ferredoxin-NADP reductase
MKLKLIKKVEEARGTKSFYWETDKPISFLPGQYFYFTLPKLNYPDPRGATRHFTISSSPTEKGTIMCTVRIRQESGYKRTLDELPIGSTIDGEGPNGTFILDEKMKTGNHVFIAGGIGITPLRSFIRYGVDKKLQIPMHLIYSNSDSDFTFKKELDMWQKEHDFVKVAYFDSSASGHLDNVQIQKILDIWHLSFDTPANWWLVGPPPFIDAMEDALFKLKIHPDKIFTEKFTGY